MIFESLWPLLFLAAVPVIIILYLLKPKGVDHLISSNLLWKKLLKNEHSRTFFEKFVHNILMYLQILIVALLVIALMSPFIRADRQGGRKILLLDTSGSMQHQGASGKSRMEEAVEQMCDYVRTMEGSRFSLVTADGAGVRLLAVDSTDTENLTKLLRGLECSDSGGDRGEVQSVLDTLGGEDEESAAQLLVYTDGAGAASFADLENQGGMELYVMGEVCANVANEYTVFTLREDGLYDVMVSAVNYSTGTASMDVGLYDGDKMIALSSLSLEAQESKICLFEQIDWEGQSIESRLSGISFSGGERDSLEADNISRAVKNRNNLISGLLVGDGNTFLEKAYRAVTGESIARAADDAAVKAGNINVVIYDAGAAPKAEEGNRLIFGNAYGESVETLENVVLDVADCDLTSGLSGFAIGVNKAYCFDLPEGAESFLEYNGKCVGYYGERDGRKEIVTGFDIRESDFPLRAEFPLFLANAMIYLSDTSWLASNSYYAGEEIALQPWADADLTQFESRPRRAGLYQVGNEEYQEPYVVRFQTTESDGRETAESVTDTGQFQTQKTRRTLRNVFLVLALILLAAEWLIYLRQMRYKGVFYPAVRGVVVLCILLALLGIQLRLGSRRTATIFLVDVSDSNRGHLEEMEEYLERVISQMPSRNEYGIVTFGKDAQVEQVVTDKKRFGGIMTLPEKAATDFEDAISKGLTLIPGGSGGRLVVLTDGKETGGDVRHMAQALTLGGTEFLSLIYEEEETPDAYVEKVELPSYLHPGDRYLVTVLVESNYETDAVLELYVGSSLGDSAGVHLNRGSNRFVFSRQVDEEAHTDAMESLKVRLYAEGDTCEENDSYSAYFAVEASPRVLVISGADTQISGFTSLLDAAGCDYSAVSPLNAPGDIDSMLEYKSIILVNTFIDELPKGFLDNIETYVKDYGCGFVCCGGEHSFALGGYRDTALETVLPVDMQLRGVDEMPPMAMVMVIDRSGSMVSSAAGSQGTNLDIAIRAASVAVDNLKDTDYVGVLTFDDNYEWQVDICRADERSDIKKSLEQISEGGGTTIKPALMEAGLALSNSDAAVKHVVLLTDGHGETDDFSGVVDAYTKEGITLSTVAVGDGSDTALLEYLAESCGGRYYYSDISTDIPRIFAQEVFLGGDSYLQNGEFALSVRTGHELAENLFPDGWPLLYGYVASSPKTASNMIITTAGKEDPVLTVWQYGLGRTVAWNSDVTGEWSGAFAGEEDYVRLWKRIVDYSTGNVNLGGDRVDVVTVGETAQITYRTEDYSGSTEIYANVIGPDGESEEIKLHATAPGNYEAQIATPQTGLYHFNIRRMENGEIHSYMTSAAAVQFSYEYKYDVSKDPYLNFVNQYGRVISPEDEIWGTRAGRSVERRSLGSWLLAFALCLFLADVAMRRFQYEPRWSRLTSRLRGAEKTDPVEKMDPVEKIDPAEKTDPAVQTTKTGKTEQTLDTSQLLRKKDNRNI